MMRCCNNVTFHTENHTICDCLNYVSTKKKKKQKKKRQKKLFSKNIQLHNSIQRSIKKFFKQNFRRFFFFTLQIFWHYFEMNEQVIEYDLFMTLHEAIRRANP